MAAEHAAVKIIAELKGARTDEGRLRAARRLREWVRVESRGGTDANFSVTMNLLNNRIFDLVNSPDANDKMNGIVAIYELTEEPVPDNETKIVRFANYLRGVPPSTSDPGVLRLAAKALGHLARAGGTMTTDFVEYEAKRALEWLQVIEPRVEGRKLASVLILRELAENAPTLFYPQLATFFTHIWTALSDSKQHIRESAARALSSCLTLVTKRYSKNRDQWYSMLYKAARSALAGGGSLSSSLGVGVASGGRTSNDVIHGALLTIGELLNNELAHDVLLAQHEKFLMPKFNEMCEMILKYRDSKDKLVRRTVIVLLPRLAYYHPEAFVRGYAEVGLAHLLACLRDPRQQQDRGTAFVVVGRIALAVGSHLSADALRPQLERIVAVVREGLSLGATVSSSSASSRVARRPFVQEALNCVGMLAKAVGPALMEYMHDLLDPMFSDGLSLMLTEALQCVASAIPALKPLVQERLLHEASLILANRPFIPPYADPAPVFATIPASADGYSTGAGALDVVSQVSLGAPASGAGTSAAVAGADVCVPSTPWSGYGMLSASTLAALSAKVASNGHGAATFGKGAGSPLGVLANLVSLAPYSVGAGVNIGASSLFGGVLPLAISTPSMMSWSRNLPSSVTGGTDSAANPSGGGVGATPLPNAVSPQDGVAPIVLANARGISKDLICLSLHILGTFDFSGVPLLPFVREVIMMYLDDDDPVIRLEAGLTCCRIMVRPTDLFGKHVDPLVMSSGFDIYGDTLDANDFDSDDEELEQQLPGSRNATKAKFTHKLVEPSEDLDATARVLGQPEILRRRQLNLLHRRFVQQRKPPQHPLLVYGTDMMSIGIGSGEFTSAAALAMAGYSGGLADAGKWHAGTEEDYISSLVSTVGAGPSLAIITQVLERVLVMAITDTDPAIRFEMLASLDRRFDSLLVETSSLRLLFQGLQDENYACREAVLALLGRLTAHNPASILPALRQLMLSVLAELEYADAHPDVNGGYSRSGLQRSAADAAARMLDSSTFAYKSSDGEATSSLSSTGAGLGSGIRSHAPAAARMVSYAMGNHVILSTMTSGGGRDHAARMLGLLIRAAQRLVAPYVPIILRSLLPHAWGTSPARPLMIGDMYSPLPVSHLSIPGTALPDVLSSSILAALGELSAVGADNMLPYMPIIIPLVVDALTQGAHVLGIGPGIAQARAMASGDRALGDSNQNPAAALGASSGALIPTSVFTFTNPILFSEVAIRTLGLLVENTGHVIVPYLDHPHLLHVLITIIARGPVAFSASAAATNRGKSSQSRSGYAQTISINSHWSLRREAMRTVGILGALDPYRHKMAQIAQAQRAASATQTAVQAKLAASVASARAKGRRLATAGLTTAVLSSGMKPGAGLPYITSEALGAVIDGKDGLEEHALVMTSGDGAGSAWDLQSNLPTIIGVAVGGGIDIDPMEAAMAGLAGEPGANVGINLDEVGVGIGMGLTGNAAVGVGVGMDGILQPGPAGGLAGLGMEVVMAGADSRDGNGPSDSNGPMAGVANIPASGILPSMVNPSEDFYPTVAMTSLLTILSDDALALHHNSALQVIMLIVKSLGLRCVSFLPRVVPAFLLVLRTSATKARSQSGGVATRAALAQNVTGSVDASVTVATASVDAMGGAPVGQVDTNATLRDTVLQQLTSLVTLVKHHIRPWLPGIFSLIRDVWPASLPGLLRLVEATASSLGEECKPYISSLVPHLLSVLSHDGTRPVLAPIPSAAVFQQDSAQGSFAHGPQVASGFQDRAAALQATPSAARTLTRHVLHTITLLVCGGRRALWGGHRHLLDDHLDLLVPAICRLFDAGVVFPQNASDDDPAMNSTSVATPASSTVGPGWWSASSGIVSNSSSLNSYGAVQGVVRRQAIDTVAAMAAAGVNLVRFIARIIQPIGRTLADSSGYTSLDIKRTAVDLLCLMILQVREDYVIWVPTIRKACMLATFNANSGGAETALNLPAGVGGAANPNSVGQGGEPVDTSKSFGAQGPSGAATVGIGAGGISGTGFGSVVRHETHERLVSVLLGFGAGYGYVGDDSLALYGYGSPLPLPTSPVDLASLLYDPGTCSADGSGARIASALALGNMGNMINVATPHFGGSVLDGLGGAGQVPGYSQGLLGVIGNDNESFGLGLSALGGGGLALVVAGPDGVKKLPVNQEMLKRAWETNARSTREDWAEWMRRFSVELLRESPSPALRSCCALAQVYSPLASDLFNAAFVAVWGELYDENQDSLMQALEAAFASETIPTYILQSLLNLAEFMEHDEKALPIDVRMLGQLAEKVGAYAKALHYKEMEFHTDPASCIEAIISINNQLDQPEAAVGILKYAQQQAHGYGQYGFRSSHMTGMPSDVTGTSTGGTTQDKSSLFGFGVGLDVQETWYEKLGRWEDALEAYERKQLENPNSLSLVLGRMRCLKALGEWQKLDGLSRDAWPRLLGNDTGLRAVAPLAARAAWALGHWDQMEEYVTKTDELSMQGAFFRAVLEVHRLAFDPAQKFMDRARKVLAAEFAAMGNESYGRAYRKMVTVQQLSEMEEILTYLRLQASGNAPGAQAYISHVRNMWEARLRGCAKNVDVWNRILSVRSLVTVASENMSEWLQFASLCRRNGRMNMALKVLMGLGMDGGGGVRESVSRFLNGKGSIHRYDAATISSSVTTNIQTTVPTTREDPFNPMFLPDHPYQPFDFNSRGDQQMLEASCRVGAESAAHPRVVYAYLKHLWHAGHRDAAAEQLKYLTHTLEEHAARRLRVQQTFSSGVQVPDEEVAMVGVYGVHQLSATEEQALRVQCHLRLGQWQEGMIEPVVTNYGGSYAFGVKVTSPSSSSPESQPMDSMGARLQRALSRAASTSLNNTATSSGLSGLRPANRMPSDSYASLITPIVTAFRTATHDCGEAGFNHYRAWHSWAIINFAAAEYHAENSKMEKERERSKSVPVAAASARTGSLRDAKPTSPPPTSSGPPVPISSFVINQAVVAHAVAAVTGFFRSIALGRTRLKAYVLQDLLRLLTLWFTHGEAPAVRVALESGLTSGAVSIEVWLQVIPQLIARINIRTPAVHKLLQALLNQIGQVHPQALVYPLTVACKSASNDRRAAAMSILGHMRRRWARLVDQAEMVSRELIRVAILWHEMWHSGLEEASRQYFGDGNVPGMLTTLLPLHEMMKSPGPQTVREVAFAQMFGTELASAHKWLITYQSSNKVGDLSQAWDIYYHIFRKINKMLPTFTTLDLPSVSPILLAAHDLELSVPGTYHAGSPVVRIMSFSPYIEVLPSKQRPRKVTLLGSNGRQYTFLLKGHEDLRQDERVMQLFGLVNTLLANDSETSRRDLSIRRYAVTPLSHDAGVVGWVPNCDTLHALIREYRDTRKILLNIEHRLMVQMAPMYDHLAVLQKVEVFRFALDNTTGQDLYKVLWLKSASSEVWLERRTNYTRSLAVMSIVGYILGLGDRHPSNLMLDRVSGKILHIDFGDCFEVAMTREKIPERIPFRLTRMLVNAMEVSGIEGNYRSICEAVMRVMRQHRDSVMAMLEAFVHDPLINWRLLNTAGPTTVNEIATTAAVPIAPSATALPSSRRRAGSVVAAAMKLAESDPAARTLVQQGLAFAQAAEDAAVATALVEAGFEGGVTDASHDALARSLVASMHGGRGERERDLMQSLGPEGTAAPTEAVNERAVAVIRRIQAKLTGRDFAEDDPIGRMMSVGIGLSGGIGLASGPDGSGTLDVPAQVQRLICAATSHENLSQSYIGWCPFW